VRRMDGHAGKARLLEIEDARADDLVEQARQPTLTKSSAPDIE
jgi:hypothetical protein